MNLFITLDYLYGLQYRQSVIYLTTRAANVRNHCGFQLLLLISIVASLVVNHQDYRTMTPYTIITMYLRLDLVSFSKTVRAMKMRNVCS